MKKAVIHGIEVELDDDVDPEEVERYGADSRTDQEVDVEALRALAEADADREQEDA